MESLCICEELQRDMLLLNLLCRKVWDCKATQNIIPLSHEEAKAKTEEWEKFNLKENIVLICFTAFAF